MRCTRPARRSRKASWRAAALRCCAAVRPWPRSRATTTTRTPASRSCCARCEEPLRQIVANTGDEPSVVLNKVVEGKGNFGYNALTGEYGDLVKMGVLDPTKVTRSALQNAASVAGLILTTDAMVADAPKDDSNGGPGMGGMGGMDM